jgi:hypothetical protein
MCFQKILKISLRESLVVNEEEYEKYSISAWKRYPVIEFNNEKENGRIENLIRFYHPLKLTKIKIRKAILVVSKHFSNTNLAITSIVLATLIGCGGSFFLT